MVENLILASASVVRLRLLQAAGLDPSVVVSSVDEAAVRQTLLTGDQTSEPGDIAEVLARAKAGEVSGRNRQACVIGADQVLALDSQVFEKPRDIAAARETLRALSGRDHELHCAVTLAEDGEVVWSHVDTAVLRVRPLSRDAIEDYLAKAGPAVLQSVGAYQLEGLGVNLFDRIEGDYFTILGLPLLPLLAQLRVRGMVSP